MEKQKSLKRNYVYNLSYQLLAIITPLITTPYISRVLGPEGIGDYAYTSSIVSYFGIVAALGTASYAQREVAYHQAEPEERSRIFYEILLLRAMMTALVAVVYAAVLLQSETYRVLYLVQLCTVFSWAFDISWFFQGMEDFKATVVRNAAVKLLSVVLILIFVRNQADLWLYALIVCGTVLLGNVTLWPFLRRYIQRVSWAALRPRRHLAGTLELFVPVISIQVYTILDQTMLGAMINTTEVGYYAQAQKLVKLVSTILYSLTAVLLPRMSVVLAAKDYDSANQYYKKTIYFSMMLIMPMMAGMMLTASYLIPVFLGPGYEACVSLLMVFSLLFITQGIGQIAGTLLISMSRQRQYTIAVTTGAILNVGCNILLIPRMGAMGAAVASVGAELCVEVLMLYYLRPVFKNRVIWKAFLNYLPPTAGMCLVLIAAEQFLEVSLISLMVLVLLGGVSYGLPLLIKKDPFLYEQLKRK